MKRTDQCVKVPARKSRVQGRTTVSSNVKLRWNHIHERIKEEIALFQFAKEVGMLERGHGSCQWMIIDKVYRTIKPKE